MMDDITRFLKKQFAGKKVLVVGLGRQGGGVGLVKFFARLGARVKVTDLKPAEALRDSLTEIEEYKVDLTLGQHLEEDFLRADVIFKGPSVPWSLPHLQKAASRGTPVEMEASFFAAHSPCPIIGVTGTRGKSTTAAMICTLLQKAGFSTTLAGNVAGISTIALLHELTSDHWVVLELSSWQLSGFHKRKISPHIAVFTSFYPDHLNFYADIDDYLNDKKAIYQYQKSGDFLIAHKSLEDLIQPIFSEKTVFVSAGDFPGRLRYLVGDHNRDNASLAYQVGRILQIDRDQILSVLADFRPLPYRLEKIAVIGGAAIYNDAASTTPSACLKALNTFKSRGIILIVGGNSKKLPVDELAVVINQSVKQVVWLTGSFTRAIQPLIDKTKSVNQTPYNDLREAFIQAVAVSRPADVIVFSPAATSFAMFANEFERGAAFAKIVADYEKKTA